MRKYQGELLKRAREELGKSQRAVIKEVGDHNCSVKTLRRIENGDESVKDEFVNLLFEYYGIERICEPRDECEEQIIRNVLVNEMTTADCIKEINGQIDEYRVLFCGEPARIKEYHMSSLVTFLIYYPLIKETSLGEALSRIGGHFGDGRGLYVLDQLERLYSEIPDSKEKRIADKLATSVKSQGRDISIEEIRTYEKLVEKNARKYSAVNEFCNLWNETGGTG